MDFITLIITAIGLAMDCFAVSLSAGACSKHAALKTALKIAFFFGLFQAVMTFIGWFAGIGFSKYIVNYDHWIAFGLLAAIGAKMLIEALKKDSDEKNINYCSNKVIFVLSIATSIDALAVGITFSMLRSALLLSVLIIGLVSALFALAGNYIGRKAGKYLGRKAEIVGGIILIGIGIKILIEHLSS